MDAVTAPTVAHAAEPDAEMAARLRLSVMRVAISASGSAAWATVGAVTASMFP